MILIEDKSRMKQSEMMTLIEDKSRMTPEVA